MFQSFNAPFPIFNQASFMRNFEARYPDDESNDPGWWAILNLVFVGARRFRAMRTLDSQPGDAHAWGYLQNAMAVLTELIMMNRDLVAVQAILGMAIALHASPKSRPCSVLISTAVKIAQSINLHRRDQGTGLCATEIEQRKRVFWLAYIYDKDMSLQTGDPPSQDDDDMDVDLPTETIELNPTDVVDINFFNLRIGLAIIQGQI